MGSQKALLYTLLSAAILLWLSLIVFIAAIGVVPDTDESIDDDGSAYGVLSVAIVLTLLMALYCTFLATKVSKARTSDMPLARTTRKHGLVLIIKGALYLSWNVTGLGILATGEALLGTGPFALNVVCALLLIYAGALLLKQHRRSLHPPMGVHQNGQMKPAFVPGPIMTTVGYAQPPITAPAYPSPAVMVPMQATGMSYVPPMAVPMPVYQPADGMTVQGATPTTHDYTVSPTPIKPQSTGTSTNAPPKGTSRMSMPFSPVTTSGSDSSRRNPLLG